MRLWSLAQPPVSAFITTVVRDFADRDDILQDVAVAVLESFSSSDDTRPFTPRAYLSDRLTDEVLSFMENNRSRPFFVYLADHAVHASLDPKTLREWQRQTAAAIPQGANPAYDPETRWPQGGPCGADGRAAATAVRKKPETASARLRCTRRFRPTGG